MTGYIHIDDKVFEEYGLTPTEAVVYCLVAGYVNNGQKFDFQLTDISEKLNMSALGARKVLTRLEDKDLVKIIRHQTSIEVILSDGSHPRTKQSIEQDINKVYNRTKQSIEQNETLFSSDINKVNNTHIYTKDKINNTKREISENSSLSSRGVNVIGQKEAHEMNEQDKKRQPFRLVVWASFNGWYKRAFKMRWTNESAEMRGYVDTIADTIGAYMVDNNLPKNEQSIDNMVSLFFDTAMLDNFHRSTFRLKTISEQANTILAKVINQNLLSNDERNNLEKLKCAAVCGDAQPF